MSMDVQWMSVDVQKMSVDVHWMSVDVRGCGSKLSYMTRGMLGELLILYRIFYPDITSW